MVFSPEAEERERFSGRTEKEMIDLVEQICSEFGITPVDAYLAPKFEHRDILMPVLKDHYGTYSSEYSMQRERVMPQVHEFAATPEAMEALVRTYIARVRQYLDETPAVGQYGKFGGYSLSSLHTIPWHVGPYTLWARDQSVTAEQISEAAHALDLRWKHVSPERGKGSGWYE